MKTFVPESVLSKLVRCPVPTLDLLPPSPAAHSLRINAETGKCPACLPQECRGWEYGGGSPGYSRVPITVWVTFQVLDLSFNPTILLQTSAFSPAPH